MFSDLHLGGRGISDKRKLFLGIRHVKLPDALNHIVLYPEGLVNGRGVI